MIRSNIPLVICLMGPTASGKTDLAVELVQQFPCEIISVDSVMVYRGMNIGAAKPSADVLRIAPHRLIDLCDPAESYSAGQFRNDALREIKAILAKGKVPLLVGGTMLYFRVLMQGMADLPRANASLRQQLRQTAEMEGWESLHATLANIDADAAARIHPHDGQRIARALEVYQLTGKTISAWQAEQTHPLADYQLLSMALLPGDRSRLHARIAARFEQMLAAGLIEEVTALYRRGDLTADLPSIRSVGYRQVWAYLTGQYTFSQLCEKAIAATRQLAKRQCTWLRSWPDAVIVDSDEKAMPDRVAAILRSYLT